MCSSRYTDRALKRSTIAPCFEHNQYHKAQFVSISTKFLAGSNTQSSISKILSSLNHQAKFVCETTMVIFSYQILPSMHNLSLMNFLIHSIVSRLLSGIGRLRDAFPCMKNTCVPYNCYHTAKCGSGQIFSTCLTFFGPN